MAYTVGRKGQIVIAKELREQLGVQSGWIALQRLVQDHIEISFLPPPHHESLKGSLSQYLERTVAPGDAWESAREAAWQAAAQEKEAPQDRERLS